MFVASAAYKLSRRAFMAASCLLSATCDGQSGHWLFIAFDALVVRQLTTCSLHVNHELFPQPLNEDCVDYMD